MEIPQVPDAIANLCLDKRGWFPFTTSLCMHDAAVLAIPHVLFVFIAALRYVQLLKRETLPLMAYNWQYYFKMVGEMR